MTRRPQPLRSLLSWQLAVVVVSAVFVAIYGWPASTAPAAWAWGSYGDGLGNASLFDFLNGAIRSGQRPVIDHAIAIPFGENLGSLPHEPLFYAAELLIGIPFGAVVALNLITFLGVPLTSWVMYRLLRFVTGSPPASFFGGIAYGCSTFLLHNTYGEPTAVQVWIFPLAAWALLVMLGRPTWVTVLLAGLAVMTSAIVNFYFTLFSALMCVVLVGGWAAAAAVARRRPLLRPVAAAGLAGGLGLLLAGSLYVLTIGDLRTPAQRIQRSSAALDVLAPDALDFVLPPQWNPWLGAPDRAHYLARLARVGPVFDLSEMSVAAPVLLLAPVGLAIALWSRSPRPPPRRGPALAALCTVGLFGLWMTVPPTVFPHSLRYLAVQYDIHHFLPQYQHFSRAIVLVQLMLVPLAATALAWLAVRRPRSGAALALVLVVLVLFESYERVPDPALRVAAPPPDAWVAAHPGQYAVADYPLIPAPAGGNEYTYVFYQRYHGHSILDGEVAGTESESMRDELRDPNRPGVAAALAALGVHYVLWHPEVLRSFDALDAAWAAPYHRMVPRPSAYRLEAAFPDGSAVYSIQQAPAPAFAFFAGGFDPPSRDAPDGSGGRRLSASSGLIGVYASEPGQRSLKFNCAGGSGSIALLAAGGPLGAWRLDAGRTIDVDTSLQAPAGLSHVMFNWMPGPGQAPAPLTCSLPETK